MNLVDVLSQCADLLEKYGGHELAAGLTIKRENLDEFRCRINECARQCLGDNDSKTVLEAECELIPSEVTMEQANELYSLEPYGVSNPVPVFAIRKIMLYDAALVGGGKHTRLTLKVDNNYISAMCFRQTLSDLDLYPGDLVDILFTLDINEYQNQRNLQMIVKDVRLSRAQFQSEEAERELFQRIHSGAKGTDLGIDEFSAQNIVPTRNDFAVVYSTLRKELRVEHEMFSIRALQHLLKTGGLKIGYVKLRYILLTFNELNLLRVEEYDAEREIYVFRYIYQHSKTNLDKSNIYRKLKADFGQKI